MSRFGSPCQGIHVNAFLQSKLLMQRVESFCDSVPIRDDRGGHTETHGGHTEKHGGLRKTWKKFDCWQSSVPKVRLQKPFSRVGRWGQEVEGGIPLRWGVILYCGGWAKIRMVAWV